MNAAGGAASATTVSAVLPATQRSLAMVLPAGTYQFTVVATNALGNSPASARSNLVTAR